MVAEYSRESTLEYLQRLVRKGNEQNAQLFAASRKAIDQSRALLAQVARDHPEID